MARSLELRVVAEGVETEEQLSVIREYGCHEYQGYLYSPAIEADAFTRLYIASEVVASVAQAGEDGAQEPEHTGSM